MSTGAIIAIVVAAALILLLVIFLVPRLRVRRRERELGRRRDHVAGSHREEAAQREQRAQTAQKRAEIAAAEAQRERAEANLHERQADLHEKGLADHELIEEHEREDFAGTSAVEDPARDPRAGQGDVGGATTRGTTRSGAER